MKNLLLLLMLFAFTANVSAETYNVKSAYEQTDRKPKHKKHKKNRKARSHAKKNGLIGHGCRGINALPGRR